MMHFDIDINFEKHGVSAVSHETIVFGNSHSFIDIFSNVCQILLYHKRSIKQVAEAHLSSHKVGQY
jgi:hypothetical protein